jgi:hypothetical protein
VVEMMARLYDVLIEKLGILPILYAVFVFAIAVYDVIGGM